MLYHPAASTNPPPHKYQRLPLRISQQVLNDFVEARPIRYVGGWMDGRAGGLVCHSIPSPFSLPPSRSYTPHHTTADTSCTHYDAFRFFAPEARALNVYGADLAKRRPGQIIHEQPGCLHAGMGALRHALRLVSVPFRNPTTTTTATSKRWHLLSYPSIPYPLLFLPHHRPLQMGPEAGALRTVGPGDGSPAPGGAVPRAGYARVPVRFAGAGPEHRLWCVHCC